MVCLTEQHYRSNSAAVNRLQNWLSPASSPRNGRIINTDLYCSPLANTHTPIRRRSVDRETTPGERRCCYYEALLGWSVGRRRGWGAAAVRRKNSNKNFKQHSRMLMVGFYLNYLCAHQRQHVRVEELASKPTTCFFQTMADNYLRFIAFSRRVKQRKDFLKPSSPSWRL